ncbi:hypothetical protein H310_03435 [Aphanomyces invadans]|uniref:Uncharacterized protein n=1 Tax=Aphanomyces invadans TaxID=157072 RepID=A0A024UHQ0_9STRA|nr:hypothetical protein H310_03435 [Aphanomyces invadans]ETW05735.1 hypothetical protein H310_03435 [Aphanomyces invadans]RHY31094.1 hypothetical protein DYB32_003759 [Aphanomyces invadans]|eukprot:XP_008865512.1 hypothetical protein H310_03435 [Aphanomyces invadans]
MIDATLPVAARRTGLKRKASAPLKRVQFSVVTEYIFQVGCAATAIPHDSVPGVGLEGPAIRVETTPVSDKRSQLMMYTHRDRVGLLRRAGYSIADMNQQSRDLQAIQKSRMETVNEYIKERREAIALQTRAQMDLARLLS